MGYMLLWYHLRERTNNGYCSNYVFQDFQKTLNIDIFHKFGKCISDKNENKMIWQNTTNICKNMEFQKHISNFESKTKYKFNVRCDYDLYNDSTTILIIEKT